MRDEDATLFEAQISASVNKDEQVPKEKKNKRKERKKGNGIFDIDESNTRPIHEHIACEVQPEISLEEDKECEKEIVPTVPKEKKKRRGLSGIFLMSI